MLYHDCIIGIFYYSLGNIRPQYRSQLKAIQLLSIAKSSVIVKYGANNILQNFMQEVKALEEVILYPKEALFKTP